MRRLLIAVIASAAVGCTAPNPDYDPATASSLVPPPAPPPDLTFQFDPVDLAELDLEEPRDFAEPADLATTPDLARPPDLTAPRDLAMVPDLARPCGGWRGGPGNRCWYVGALKATCATTCRTHGGFDADSGHVGDDVGRHFVPMSTLDAWGPQEVEAVAFRVDGHDKDYRTPATGKRPSGVETPYGNRRFLCACLE